MLSDEMRDFYHQSIEKSKTEGLPDDPIEKVALSAGYVGLAIGSKYLDDDSLQDGLAHLCHAATLFDETKSAWGTYATNCTMRRHWGLLKKKKFKASNLGEDRADVMKSIVDHRTAEPDKSAEYSDEREKIARFVSKLRHELQTVIVLKYGLNGNRPHNRNEIADITRVSKEWVRQQEHRALAELRTMMG